MVEVLVWLRSYYGLVSAIITSWGNDVTVIVAAADSLPMTHVLTPPLPPKESLKADGFDPGFFQSSPRPIDSIFDAMPGELFVVKNAGNTCSQAGQQ